MRKAEHAKRKRDGDACEDGRSATIRGEQDLPSWHAVHPDADREAEQGRRRGRDGAEQAHFKGTGMEHDDRGQRDREERDLIANVGHGLAGPQLQEFGVTSQPRWLDHARTIPKPLFRAARHRPAFRGGEEETVLGSGGILVDADDLAPAVDPKGVAV